MSDPLTLLLGERVLRPPPQDVPPLAEEATGQGSPWLDTASLAGPGRLVGLYFSAQWCPPCRAFTARLAELYRTLRAQDQEHDRVHRFEVVLVSSDAEVRGWDEQRRSMPWGALPFEHRQRKFSLCRKFKVTTIPTLILLDSCNTHVLTKNGVATVTEDPHGLEFPWAPKPFAQTIAGPLIRPSGEMTDYDVLEDAHIGLYFSANWCPPCKAFTPMLCETYRRVCEAGKKFEIIFVSSDRSEESFQQYFGDMPWLAVPYADTQRRESLGKLYSIQGIPSLILLDPAGRLITSTGRVALLDDRLGLRFPWEPAALSQLSPTNAELLNQEPALVLFVDSNEDEELGPVRQMLQPIAEKVVAESKANGEEQPLHFFYAGEDDMADSIRDFTSLPDCAPLLAILDVPARAKFVKDAEELSPSVVHEFLQDYLQGRLEAEPI